MRKKKKINMDKLLAESRRWWRKRLQKDIEFKKIHDQIKREMRKKGIYEK